MTTPEIPVEQPQDWFFTFGADHLHPDTGQRLGKSYVRIHGTCDSTRDVMFAAFGNRWSHQYPTAERAGAEKYELIEVPMPGADIDAATAGLDVVLTTIGPPPGWNPPACGCSEEVADAACPDHGVHAFLKKLAGES